MVRSVGHGKTKVIGLDLTRVGTTPEGKAVLVAELVLHVADGLDAAPEPLPHQPFPGAIYPPAGTTQ